MPLVVVCSATHPPPVGGTTIGGTIAGGIVIKTGDATLTGGTTIVVTTGGTVTKGSYAYLFALASYAGTATSMFRLIRKGCGYFKACTLAEKVPQFGFVV